MPLPALNQLLFGDCLELLPELPAQSVDLIIADLPYGSTACRWDTKINLERLWQEWRRVLRPEGIVVATATQPFTTDLIASNRQWFKHSWIWDKGRPVGFMVARFRPMQRHEDVLIFASGKVRYNPQKTPRDKVKRSRCYSQSDSNRIMRNDGKIREYSDRYPSSIIRFSNACQTGKTNATQKPTALFEYLIKTYSEPGATILDCTIGSGTTAIAAMNTERQWIGMESDPEQYAAALERIKQAEEVEQRVASLRQSMANFGRNISREQALEALKGEAA